jgi:hypothetical protein
MKARRSTTSARISHPDERTGKITAYKKMLKMKIAPQSLLKTKGQKKVLLRS